MLTSSQHQRRNSLGNERRKSFIAISCPQHSFKSISKPDLGFGTLLCLPHRNTHTHKHAEQQLPRERRRPRDREIGGGDVLHYRKCTVDQHGVLRRAYNNTPLWSGLMPQSRITRLTPSPPTPLSTLSLLYRSRYRK